LVILRRREVSCALHPLADVGTALVGAVMVTSTASRTPIVFVRVVTVSASTPGVCGHSRFGLRVLLIVRTLAFPWTSLIPDHLTGEENIDDAPRGCG